MDEKLHLRARDFWTSIVLITVSSFFIWQTSHLPFFDARSAGVDSARWYNSAALVPFCIFGALLVLSCALLVIAVKYGGARSSLSVSDLGFEWNEAVRLGTVSAMLLCYIVALVPRVDFVLSSALLITALIWGFHTQAPRRMYLSALLVGIAGLYSLLRHFPREQWNAAWDDDLVTLAAWLALTGCIFLSAFRSGRVTRVDAMIPLLSVAMPLVLVCAMAFGFRQNVPNRTGLVFSQLEYHFYVTIKPIFQDR